MQTTHIAEKFLTDTLKQCPNLHHIYREQEKQFPLRDPYSLIQSKIACEYTMEYCLRSTHQNQHTPISPNQLNDLCNRVIIASVWQYTRSIYRFDPLIYQELIHQDLDIFPASILDDFPEPSIFIETQNDAHTQEGFFAQIDKQGNIYRLLFLFISSKEEAFLTQLPIRPYEKLSTMIHELLHGFQADRAQMRYAEQKFKQALNLILYFGCNNVDYSGRKKPSYKKNIKPKKATTYYTMGRTLGNAIREASQGQGKQVPHVRRAHYHHYWTGKRDGERNRIRRFVYPIFVNCKEPTSNKNLVIKTRYIHIKERGNAFFFICYFCILVLDIAILHLTYLF